MKRPVIGGAGAVAVLALAAATMQASSPRAAAHDETAAGATVTVQHWAGGTYTPGLRAGRDISAHVTALQRSLRRTDGERSVNVPAAVSRHAPAGSNIPGAEHDTRTSTLPSASGSTSAPRRGA